MEQVKEKQEEEIIFFTYGTLKKGFGNNRLLRDAEFLGAHTTEPKYTLFDGGFPIVERGGETAVVGELWKTNNPGIISNVFMLEGCKREQNHPDSWYTYDKINTPQGEACIFVMNAGRSGRSKILPNGKWGVRE